MFILSSGMLIFRRLGQTNMPHSGVTVCQARCTPIGSRNRTYFSAL